MNNLLGKYKHISFDLDGTLVHTVPGYRYKIVPAVVNQLGGNINDNHHIDRFWFESGRDNIIKNHFNVEPDDFWKLFRIIDTAIERSIHTKAYNDAELAIRKLKKIGKIISIITGAPYWIAKMEIAKLNNAPHDFYFSITGSKFKEKPNSESFYFVMDSLSAKPEETVYIGNSNEDAYFAKNAGVDFIYLERKEHKFDLRDYAVATINSLSQLF